MTIKQPKAPKVVEGNEDEAAPEVELTEAEKREAELKLARENQSHDITLNGGNCSHDGIEYVSKNGKVTVPAFVAVELIASHGCTIAED